MTIGSGPFGPQIDVTGTSDITQLGDRSNASSPASSKSTASTCTTDSANASTSRSSLPTGPCKRPCGTRSTATTTSGTATWTDSSFPRTPRQRAGTRAWPPCCAYATGRNACSPSNETRTPPTPPWTKASGTLDGEYDRFVASYGRLNSKENLRVFDPNNSDPSLNQLYSLRRLAPTGSKPKETCFPRGSSRRCLRCPNTWMNPSTRWPSASTVWDMWISTSSDDCSTPGRHRNH